MGNRLFHLALAAALIAAATGCNNGASGGISGPTVDLVGSRQGQAVGFADVDGDGVEDKIVGAPYAASGATTGAVLVTREPARSTVRPIPPCSGRRTTISAIPSSTWAMRTATASRTSP